MLTGVDAIGETERMDVCYPDYHIDKRQIGSIPLRYRTYAGAAQRGRVCPRNALEPGVRCGVVLQK
jgi:hypothetical protein